MRPEWSRSVKNGTEEQNRMCFYCNMIQAVNGLNVGLTDDEALAVYFHKSMAGSWFKCPKARPQHSSRINKQYTIYMMQPLIMFWYLNLCCEQNLLHPYLSYIGQTFYTTCKHSWPTQGSLCRRTVQPHGSLNLKLYFPSWIFQTWWEIIHAEQQALCNNLRRQGILPSDAVVWWHLGFKH